MNIFLKFMYINYYFVWSFFLFILSISFIFFFLFLVKYDLSFILEWEIGFNSSFSIIYLIYLDWVSTLFISLVLFISFIVVLYRYEYMGGISLINFRFLFLVILFVIRIILIIIRPNLISIILGWDGLGLISYLLVVYYRSIKSYLAGIVTCLTNRLGDVGILICSGWVFRYGRWHFIFYNDLYNSMIFYLIIISCFTKRAQLPFSCWLPAAIAAPTPVSSLVHSSTLVTAGVYLLIRFYNSLYFYNNLFLFLRIITIIFSSFCANYEFDLKKIIALSTLSQLGLIIVSLFIGIRDYSFFHLLTHAIFKSLLFLCAGIIIFYMGDNQDIRSIGRVCLFLPYVTSCFNLSNLALCGIPFLSGFYSKDLILESCSFISFSWFLVFLFYLSFGLTSCYTIRLFYYTIIKNYLYNRIIFIKDEFMLIKIRIYILSIWSVLFGCFLIWLINFDISFILFPFWLRIIRLVIVSFGFYLGSELNNQNYLMSYNFYLYNGSIWFIYRYLIYLYNFNYKLSSNLLNVLNWGEFYGGQGLSFYILNLSNLFQYYSINSFKIFFISCLFWLILIIYFNSLI